MPAPVFTVLTRRRGAVAATAVAALLLAVPSVLAGRDTPVSTGRALAAPPPDATAQASNEITVPNETTAAPLASANPARVTRSTSGPLAPSDSARSATTTTTSGTSAGSATTSGAAAASTTTTLGWVLTFQDTFSGTTIDSRKWGVYRGPGNGNTGPRSASNAFVRDGHLVLRNRKINGVWHGAGVSNARSHSQTYGKYEIRARVDAGEGLKASALLWPNADWPPEIDFFEVPAAPGDRPKYTVTNHYGTRADHRMQHGKVFGRFTQWHVVGLEWTPTALRFTLDGRVVATMTGHAPRERMWLGLQTNTGGLTKPGPSTPSIVDFEIDWVRIYRRA